MPPDQALHVAGFGDHDFSGAQTFIERQEFAGRIAFCGDHGKHSQIPMADRIQHFVAGRRADFSRPRISLISHTNPATISSTAKARKFFDS